MAFDISAFTEPEEFKRTTGDIMRSLRSSRRMPGRERIYTPGEKEHLTRMERKGAPINQSLRAELAQMRDELRLEGYGFL